MKLPRMAQQHSTSSAHGLHNPADMHIGIAVAAQLPHLLPILAQAHNCE